MKHPELSLLQDYLENTISGSLESKVRDHLTGCDQCTNILLEMTIVERKVREHEGPSLSHNLKARITGSAHELLRERRERIQAREELKDYLRNWREEIFPEIRVPAIQLCSLSLVILTVITVEKVSTTEETVFEPISTEVHVIKGDES